MNNDQLREIIQLIIAAKNYYAFAKEGIAKLNLDLTKINIKELAGKFEGFGWSKDDEELLILVSHLSSCGIRISTINEVLGNKPKNNKLYPNNCARLDPKYICYFLRDNVCHKEPGDKEKVGYQKRQEFLNELTIGQLYELITQSIAECKKKVLEFFNGNEPLQDWLNKQM